MPLPSLSSLTCCSNAPSAVLPLHIIKARDSSSAPTLRSRAARLVGALENSPKFYSSFWDFGLGAFFNLTFGTDSSLTTSAGWDNVPGMGTPNGLAFIRVVAK